MIRAGNGIEARLNNERLSCAREAGFSLVLFRRPILPLHRGQDRRVTVAASARKRKKKQPSLA
jgi:hypothetical protein